MTDCKYANFCQAKSPARCEEQTYCTLLMANDIEELRKRELEAKKRQKLFSFHDYELSSKLDLHEKSPIIVNDN